MKHTCGVETVTSHAGGETFEYCRKCKVEVPPPTAMGQEFNSQSGVLSAEVLQAAIDSASNREPHETGALTGLAAWLPSKSPAILDTILLKVALANRDYNITHDTLFISRVNFRSLQHELSYSVRLDTQITINTAYGKLNVYPTRYLNDLQYSFSALEIR